MENESNRKGKATIVITYNSVRNHPSGTYEGKNGPVVIYSHENTRTWGEDEAESKLSQIMHGLYGRLDSQDVEQIYLYVGLYAKEGALRAAKNLASNGARLSLVACDCDAGEKELVAKRLGVPIIWSECGGRNALADIVERALN